ncbi:hypothetical protein GS438_21880 [Rhodococcus hoagii]|nr:hypothetical protein [Prescottella equi]
MHKSAEMDALLQQFSEEAQQLKAPSAFRERFIANLVIAAVAGVAQVVVGLLNFDSFVSWLMWVLFVCGLVGAGGCAVAMVRERNRITRRCEDLASRIVELDRRDTDRGLLNGQFQHPSEGGISVNRGVSKAFMEYEAECQKLETRSPLLKYLLGAWAIAILAWLFQLIAGTPISTARRSRRKSWSSSR